eukprot:TRINITY_DN8931_c0_g1_i6.p1 TRINITY_DN8931_c0_g1~~TRINITY_DN8931_c0_g1_i6.p1  ORF type:complete len:160 (-),score=12.32 TRINITY_DN8931_c0_g1_i6:1-480(-)
METNRWLTDLPLELWYYTFSLVDQHTIRLFYLTCKTFYNAINSSEALKKKMLESPHIWREGPNYELSVDKRTLIKKGRSGLYDCTGLGPWVEPGSVAKWHIKMAKCNVYGQHIMVGVAKEDIDQSKIGNYSTNGWYFYANSSSLSVSYTHLTLPTTPYV